MEMMGWQMASVEQYANHLHIAPRLQTDNHASTSSLNFFTGRMLFLTDAKPTNSAKALKATN